MSNESEIQAATEEVQISEQETQAQNREASISEIQSLEQRGVEMQSQDQANVEENRNDENKIRRFNDIVLLTGWVLEPFRTIEEVDNVQSALEDIVVRTEILTKLKNLPTEDLELFSKRVKNGLKLKRIFEGIKWDFMSIETNHDFRWLFTGTSIDTLKQKVTGFEPNNGLFIYEQYKIGLDFGLQKWEEDGSDPLKRPAYFSLPDPNLYLNRFIQMELIAKIFYKIHPELL